MTWSTSRVNNVGVWMMVVGSAGGFANAIFGYFWQGNGIHGTWGALGVIGSSVLIVIVALLMAFGLIRPRWLRIVLLVLLFPAIVGTAFCAYLLESNSFVGLIAFALLGWLAHLVVGPRVGRTPASIASGAL